MFKESRHHNYLRSQLLIPKVYVGKCLSLITDYKEIFSNESVQDISAQINFNCFIFYSSKIIGDHMWPEYNTRGRKTLTTTGNKDNIKCNTLRALNRHAQIKVHGSGSTNHDMRFKYQYEGSGITFYLRIHINFITNQNWSFNCFTNYFKFNSMNSYSSFN